LSGQQWGNAPGHMPDGQARPGGQPSKARDNKQYPAAHGQPGPDVGQPHMPASGGRRRRDRGSQRLVLDGRLAWSVVFLVAAVVGGLAAADIVHERPVIAVILAVLVALVPVSFLFEGALKTDLPAGQAKNRPGPTVSRPQTGEQPRHDGQEPVRRPSVPAPSVPAPSVPAPTELAPPGWWEKGQGAARPTPQEPEPGAGAPPPQPAAEAPYQPEPRELSRALIAQCPNCGSFQLSAAERRHEWALGCLECAYRWTWHRGAPAPSVQVRPEIRRQQER
jgi:hypothetical protein